VTLPAAAGADATRDRTSRIFLDSYGHALHSEDALGSDRLASYTARGDVAKEWQIVNNAGDLNIGTDDTTDALVTVYRYDALGRQIQVVEPQLLARAIWS